LGAIGEIIFDRELSMITLNRLPIHWEPFIQSINGRSKLPKFDILCADCTQEETRLAARGMQCYHHDGNQALATYARKRKGKRRGFKKTFKGRKSTPTSEHKKKDMSKVQCFRCDKYVYYVKNCPTWKKGKQHDSTVNVDSKPPHRNSRNESMNDEYYFFISSLSSMVPTSNDIWLIESGASKHMTGYREHLIDLVEKEFHFHVVLGDDAKYIVKGVGSTSL
jgi:hypothetical protein